MKNVKEAAKTVEEKMDEIIELMGANEEIALFYDPMGGINSAEPWYAMIGLELVEDYMHKYNSATNGCGATLSECLEDLLQSVRIKNRQKNVK